MTLADEIEWANQVDCICDEFEAALQTGNNPKINEFLGEYSGPRSTELFVELLRVEVSHRHIRGETPTRVDYETLYPNFVEAIAKLTEFGDETSGIRLIAQVGSGSFGTVWKAWDPKLQRVVAVKKLTNFADQTNLRIFQSEARAIARLNHPNIVQLFAADLTRQDPYLVLEFVDGASLAHRLLDGPLSPDEAATICRELASAIEHAHRRNVLHRDIKPANVLIDDSGNPMLTDFGLARRIDATTTITRPGSVLGTLAYMSPEQARGCAKNKSFAVDIYSLGAVLFELLTGQRPFGGSPEKVLHDILHTSPTTPRAINRKIPADLDRICRFAMARDPNDRYTTAEFMAQDLSRFLGIATHQS